jgi:hypothetical protein
MFYHILGILSFNYLIVVIIHVVFRASHIKNLNRIELFWLYCLLIQKHVIVKFWKIFLIYEYLLWLIIISIET